MTWLIPLGITLLVAAIVGAMTRDVPKYASYAENLSVFIVYLIAIIVSLAAWLVWAVVT